MLARLCRRRLSFYSRKTRKKAEACMSSNGISNIIFCKLGHSLLYIFFDLFFFFFFVSSNQSDVLSRMRGHHNVGLGANGIFTTPQAGHGLLLGVELQAGLAVKGVGTATGNTLLVAGEGEHG